MATLDLVYQEFGVRTVYFHTYDGGLTMKRTAGQCAPPRSLNTDLPQRFCFQETDRAPRVLRSDKRLRAQPPRRPASGSRRAMSTKSPSSKPSGRPLNFGAR
jgi:hypothetical protein